MSDQLTSRHKITAKKRRQVRVYADLAKVAGLSCPVGRAAYLVNRLDNNGELFLAMYFSDTKYEHPEQAFMATATEATAQKWEAQFKAGVHLKKSIQGWAAWEAAGQAPWGCSVSGAHTGTREDPYQHNSRAEARNCHRRYFYKLYKKDGVKIKV